MFELQRGADAAARISDFLDQWMCQWAVKGKIEACESDSTTDVQIDTGWGVRKYFLEGLVREPSEAPDSRHDFRQTR